jgi:hypothetical protein
MYVGAPFSKIANFRNKTRRLAMEGLAAAFFDKGTLTCRDGSRTSNTKTTYILINDHQSDYFKR